VRADSGFTLVETLISLLVLTLLAVSVAAVVASASRSVSRSRSDITAVLLAQRRLEQLRRLPWGFGSAHRPSAGVDLTTDLSGEEPRPGGTGLGGSSSMVLSTDTAGSVDYLDASGRWMASAAPPAGFRFTRRWSVDHIAGWPDIVVLRVRVIDRLSEVNDVVLATVKARTAG
jgi:type II secretory pathway component PulJ